MKSIIIALSLAGALFIMGGFIDRNSKIPENSKGFAVVELFTSEGCSSCPPADELIEQVQKDNKNKQVYILAFHVDYWDHQDGKTGSAIRSFQTGNASMQIGWTLEPYTPLR